MPSPLLLDAISASWDGVRALHSVTAMVPPGSVTALHGANGSGKSTLLAVIAGVLRPDSGQASHDHERLALVVQQSAVTSSLPITVREAVSMGRWAELGALRRLRADDRQIVRESINAVALDGLESRPLASLSGGQRQRVLVAQGLAQRAPLLLLDEPTASLDAESRELIASALEAERARGVTIVHATHDAAVIASADHRIELSAGRVVSHAPTGAIRARA